MLDHRLIDGLMTALAPVIREHVDTTVKAVTEPLKAQIKEFAERPQIKGEPGKDADPAVIERMVSEAVAKLPTPQDGKSVTIEEIKPLVEEAVAAIPKPQDGKSVTLEEVRPLVDEAVAALPKAKDGVGLSEAIIDREGVLVLTLTDGSTKKAGLVVGKDADRDEIATIISDEIAKWPKPENGKDGLGFDDLSVSHDGERKFTLRFQRGEQVKEFSFDLGIPLDRGVWKEGEWKKGDGVTWGGSFWIAQKDTTTRPDTPNSDWRLSTKRGRDGASAYDLARKAGFKGSETEWLASLKGEPGKNRDPAPRTYA